MKSLLRRFFAFLSLVSFCPYLTFAFPKSIEYPQKCSMKSVAKALFPEGRYADIDEAVARPFCEESDKPKLAITSLRIENSPNTELYIINWEENLEFSHVTSLLYSSKFGIWVSNVNEFAEYKYNENQFLVSLCSKFVVYHNSNTGSKVSLLTSNFPLYYEDHQLIAAEIVYQDVTVSKPGISSVCNETVFVLGRKNEGKKKRNGIWELKYHFEKLHGDDWEIHLNGWLEVNATGASGAPA